MGSFGTRRYSIHLYLFTSKPVHLCPWFLFSFTEFVLSKGVSNLSWALCCVSRVLHLKYWVWCQAPNYSNAAYFNAGLTWADLDFFRFTSFSWPSCKVDQRKGKVVLNYLCLAMYFVSIKEIELWSGIGCIEFSAFSPHVFLSSL